MLRGYETIPSITSIPSTTRKSWYYLVYTEKNKKILAMSDNCHSFILEGERLTYALNIKTDITFTMTEQQDYFLCITCTPGLSTCATRKLT